MNFEQLKEYVKEKHKGQMRKHGTPYYLHPFAVADILNNLGYGLDFQTTALLHDLLEDTDVTIDEIEHITDKKIANAVKLLTKEENYIIQDYINRINNNEIAKAVKLADRIHNLSESTLASVNFRQKYIFETKEWYINLAKETLFENLLIEALKNVEESIIVESY